jgi:hypothetical protein
MAADLDGARSSGGFCAAITGLQADSGGRLACHATDPDLCTVALRSPRKTKERLTARSRVKMPIAYCAGRGVGYRAPCLNVDSREVVQ